MKLLRLSFLLILGALGWFLGNQRRRLQSEASEQAVEQQNSSADNRHHQPSPDDASNVGSVETTVAQARADNEQESREVQQRQLTVAKWLNWITAFAAIVGFVGMVILFRTLRATERAVDQSVRNFQWDQRAWVSVKTLTMRGQIKPGSELFAVIQVENTGKTPALEVVINHALSFQKPTKENLAGFPKIGTFGRIVIAPNGTFVSPQMFSGKLTGTEIEKLNKDIPYVFGTISYRDVFGEDHQTWFCAFYRLDFFPALRFCDTLNYMD